MNGHKNPSDNRNLSASTSVELDALHAIANKNLDMEPSEQELIGNFDWLF